MKKIISSLVASGMLIAAVAPSYASASSITPLNELSVESSVLTEGITVDGNYIPSGATAVTVDISNNTGFDNSKTVLELGEAFDVIEGVDNKPLVTNGSTFDDSLVCAVEIDNVITVVSASADVKENDGSLFTFYVNVNENCEDKEISILDVNENRYESLNLDSNNRTVYYYGDANGDSIIDARDASLVLTVVTNDTNYPNHRLPINYVQNNITSLFPNIPYAKIVDTFTQVTYDAYGNPIWNNNYVSEEDAYDILTYYAISSATESSTVYTGMCGEPFNP